MNQLRFTILLPNCRLRWRRQESEYLANPELDLLDIREPDEIEKGKIEGALTVDDELADQIISTWSREREIIVYCERGKSSLEATQFLRQKGLQNVRSLKGGFSVWSAT